MKEVIAAGVDREALRSQIKDKYTDVALRPEIGFHFHTGRSLARMLDYDDNEVAGLPEGVVDSFAGTGNPFKMGELREGEIALDMGCGAGFDTLLAARRVGDSGRVIAVDMTEAMLQKMQKGAAGLGLRNVDGRLGYLEDLPVEDESVDVVISNGVLNLTPDKLHVMREIHRVLKPGGRFQIGDIVVHLEVPQSAKDDIDLWSGCIAGALQYSEWQWVLDQAGFQDIQWGREVDVFSGSKHESDAAEFETRGVTFTGRKR